MALRQLPTALLLLYGLCAAVDARKDPQDGSTAAPTAEQRPSVVTQAAVLELTNATLAKRLQQVASAEKCIIFTTTSAFLPPLLNMTRNWFAHVHKCAASAAPLAHCLAAEVG